MSRRRATRDARPAPGQCCEIVEFDGQWPIYCEFLATEGVTLTATADGHSLAALGRHAVVGGPYCATHGGRERALAEARGDWAYRAPATVGGDREVTEAGCRSLTSEHAIVVIRHTPEVVRPTTYSVRITAEQRAAITDVDRDATLRAFGLQPRLETADEAWAARAYTYVRDRWGLALEVRVSPGGSRPCPRPWSASLGLGSRTIEIGHYATEEAAAAAAHAEWRARLDREVAEITEARGGTLAWGLPVTPRATPVVLRPAPGQSAWEVYGGPRASGIRGLLGCATPGGEP